MGRRKRTRKIGPTGGLGSRYGVTARKRYSETISGVRRKHTCPQCSSNSVRRESVGIWACTKCGFRFAGGAYVPTTKIGASAQQSAKNS